MWNLIIYNFPSYIEALTIHGQKDGQTLMINNGSEVEVYQWDKAETKWIKIGVAVGSSDGGGGSSGTRQKTSYLGKVRLLTFKYLSAWTVSKHPLSFCFTYLRES